MKYGPESIKKEVPSMEFYSWHFMKSCFSKKDFTLKVKVLMKVVPYLLNMRETGKKVF